MAKLIRSSIRAPLADGTLGRSSGVSRRWVYSQRDRKLVFTSEPIGHAPYREVYRDLDSFGKALLKKFKASPLWAWYSRSSWGGYCQASIRVYATRTSDGYVSEHYIWGQIRQRSHHKPKAFFNDSVVEIIHKLNTRYSIYVVDELALRILHHGK